ncbi:hypothetical protein Aca07nite_83960 [Actinoplanes capillaceus]|uniref:Uncharacterized protein n=1 Tax=Actinoplanes campanulatus TaxID=113559 RepID=A0ABQ3WXU3_9ACTN|nr:hypothetical protein [Actinoplanes capillaceus]GID51121.1 hypothetical protein Aca07nite_83960 [Actinoplanes capillaceus]
MFQVVQDARERLTVRLLLEDGADAAQVWTRVHDERRTLRDGRGLTHVVLRQDSRPPARTPGGKFRTVYTDLPS